MSQEQPSSAVPNFESVVPEQGELALEETAQPAIAQPLTEPSPDASPVAENRAEASSESLTETLSERIFVDDFFAEESITEASVTEASIAEAISVEEDLAERSAEVRAGFDQETTPSMIQAESSERVPKITSSPSEAKPAVRFQKKQSPPQQRSQVLPRSKSQKAQSQVWQSIQRFWQETQPKLKRGAIASFKGSLQFVQNTLDRQTQPNSPGSSSHFQVPAWIRDLGKAFSQAWQQFWRGWKRVLPSLRSLLPTGINRTLSDQALSGAIAGMLILVLWLTSSLLSGHPTPSTAIAPASSPAINPAIEKNGTGTADTLPPPALKRLPDQQLIAQIQDQVAEVSDQSARGLIQSVQANFRGNRLTVKVGDGWYELSPNQQIKLANDILRRTQQLDFVKLELLDPENHLLARSPVVGTEMVILRTIAPTA